MKRMMLLAVVVAAVFSSCRPDSKEITVEVRTEYNGMPFAVSEELFKGDTVFKFDLFHYYLSNLTFGDQVVEEVLFINIDDTASAHYTYELNDGVDRVEIGIGLDSVQNAMDPTTFAVDHPLSSANAMYWSWASKYRFLKIDGRVNASGTFGADDVFLAWHTGLDELYRVKAQNLSVEPGNHVVITFNLNELMSGVNMATETVTHTTVDDIAIARKLSDNAVNAVTFSVE